MILFNRLVSLAYSQSSSIYYVITNLFVTFLMICRSFFFLEHLSFSELGLITVLQTAALLLGFSQLGVINGGFRKISIDTPDEKQETNNSVFSFLLTFVPFVVCISFMLNGFLQVESVSSNFLAFLFALALALLIANWLTNYLVSERDFILFNYCNLSSAIISFIVASLVSKYGILAGYSALVLQPLLLCTFILVFSPKYRPNALNFSVNSLRAIFKQGFIPFLSALLYMLFLQIERWLVVLGIDQEALGQIYIYILVITLWQLVPNSLMGIFFPQASKLYSQKSLNSYYRLLKVHFALVLLYSILGALALWFLLSPIVAYFFPNHSPFLFIVFIAIPGLVLKTAAEPLAIYFNSSLELKPLLSSEIISLLFYFLLMLILMQFGIYSLEWMAYGFVFYSMFKTTLRLISFSKSVRNRRDYAE